MNKYIKYIVLIALTVGISASCSKGIGALRNVNIESCRISDVQPYGFTSVKAKLEVDIKNKSRALEIKDILGTVKMDGQEFVTVNCEKVSIGAKCDSTYIIPVTCRICAGFNPITALGMFRNKDFNKSKVDLSASIGTPGAKGDKVTLKDVPVSKFLKLQ